MATSVIATIVVGVLAILLGSSSFYYYYPVATTATTSTIMGNVLSLCDSSRNLLNQDLVESSIVSVIERDKTKRDNGTSLIGTFVRLAWHCAGTYDASDGSGGSNGGRIRFEPERDWGANAGLSVAMDALEEVKVQYPEISYADLYTLAGKVAVEYAGGPTIPYQLGRIDDDDGSTSPPDGRLPDADKDNNTEWEFTKTSQHMRDVFYRMGFSDQEMICLLGAHTLGRCHIDRSGYWGPWNKAENKFNNALYKFLLEKKWTPKQTHEGKKWEGPLQYENDTGELMMLPSCMAMIHDDAMKEWVVKYANDEKLFFEHFAKAFGKLLALGVPEKQQQNGFLGTLFC